MYMKLEWNSVIVNSVVSLCDIEENSKMSADPTTVAKGKLSVEFMFDVFCPTALELGLWFLIVCLYVYFFGTLYSK